MAEQMPVLIVLARQLELDSDCVSREFASRPNRQPFDLYFDLSAPYFASVNYFVGGVTRRSI